MLSKLIKSSNIISINIYNSNINNSKRCIFTNVNRLINNNKNNINNINNNCILKRNIINDLRDLGYYHNQLISLLSLSTNIIIIIIN